MGKVIRDFRASSAPQFKGKSDKKIRQMAIAAKLNEKLKFAGNYEGPLYAPHPDLS